jgi:hypothetical protein
MTGGALEQNSLFLELALMKAMMSTLKESKDIIIVIN